MIFEPFIGGQEIQVAVINGSPLGAIELKPKREFYDYKAKYSKSAKTKHIMPLFLIVLGASGIGASIALYILRRYDDPNT